MRNNRALVRRTGGASVRHRRRMRRKTGARYGGHFTRGGKWRGKSRWAS